MYFNILHKKHFIYELNLLFQNAKSYNHGKDGNHRE